MEIADWPNLVALLLGQAERLGNRPFLWEKHGGAYRAQSWRAVADDVCALAAALRDGGVKPGDRVLLLGPNAPKWAIADFAIMAAGGVTVPVYTTNTVANHEHILSDTGAKVAIVASAALAKPFLEAARKSKNLRRVIAMEAIDQADAGQVTIEPWNDALAAGRQGAADIAADARAIPPIAVACIIYTSGTGGAPKGVMLSHRAVLTNCVGAIDVLKELDLSHDTFLSFLPLSHAYEHTAGLMFPVSIGAEIYFAERADTLMTNMAEARPTIMTAVPRLYEIVRDRMLKGISAEGAMKKRLFWLAVEIGRKRYEAPGTLTFRERLLDKALERLVRDRVRARFGGRLKALVSGGAPLDYELGVFFTALGLRLLQGYGQTEAAPVISCNHCMRVKLRTVGPPLKHVEVMIADDGEILVRGPLLMDGYWGLPKLTAEIIRDGWLHTGDIGVLDHDGYLQITDRKKDIIVLSAGDTLSPLRIEGMLTGEPEIEAAVAVGDGRPHVAAVVVPDKDFVAAWKKKTGAAGGLAEFARDEAFRSAIAHAVDRANKRLSQPERVRRFVVADQPFTIENGMITPTLKPRRHEVLRRWGADIERLY